MDLQSLDRKTRDLEQTLSTIAGRVTQLREESAKFETELTTLTQDDHQAAAARKQLERELAEGEARLRNKRMRQNMVRNDKELQALGHEVDSLKENNQRLEAEVLAAMEASEPRVARIKELTESLAKSKSELAAAEKEIAGQVEELKEQIA